MKKFRPLFYVQCPDIKVLCRYQGIVAHDCVKVWIDEENNEGATIKRVYFGKCMVFLQDSEGKQFVVIQWFNRHEPNGFDKISKVPSFKLAPETHTKSYSTLPLTAIFNNWGTYGSRWGSFLGIIISQGKKDVSIRLDACFAISSD